MSDADIRPFPARCDALILRLHDRVLLPALGLTLTLLLWWCATDARVDPASVAAGFSPAATWAAALTLAGGDALWPHLAASLHRVLVGLALALAVGVPLGLLLGASRVCERVSTAVCRFLPMVSPLAWLPLAIMTCGLGDAPLFFILAGAALWPIVHSVTAGVKAIDRRWLQLARSLAANPVELLLGIILPAIVGHLLAGVRRAIGLIWVVLIPAEMLAAGSGLGALILDARARLADGELMAVILGIGLLGYLFDLGVHLAQHAWDRRDGPLSPAV